MTRFARPVPVAARGVSQRGGASRRGSESAARDQASGRGRTRPSRPPVRPQGADLSRSGSDVSDGALYRIYRDRKTNAWFADGLYD